MPWAADACEIEFGSVPNLSNYGNFFINFECCDISEKNLMILFIFGTVAEACETTFADVCKIAFGSMPNLSNYSNIFLKFDVFVAIPQKRMG